MRRRMFGYLGLFSRDVGWLRGKLELVGGWWLELVFEGRRIVCGEPLPLLIGSVVRL